MSRTYKFINSGIYQVVFRKSDGSVSEAQLKEWCDFMDRLTKHEDFQACGYWVWTPRLHWPDRLGDGEISISGTVHKDSWLMCEDLMHNLGFDSRNWDMDRTYWFGFKVRDPYNIPDIPPRLRTSKNWDHVIARNKVVEPRAESGPGGLEGPGAGGTGSSSAAVLPGGNQASSSSAAAKAAGKRAASGSPPADTDTEDKRASKKRVSWHQDVQSPKN